ncbi:MAG: T9SS type A sorting domain-containing protein [Bacteroidales bacterium]|nr:T9SS type A sorting domain-containing protein [Bacteroidales bacterium]
MKNRELLFGLVILFLSCIGLNSVNAQTNDQWISLGPNNVSGRSRTIIFDRFNNDIMYSGGVAGGLFISVNNGKNWQEITLGDGQQNLAITAIAQDNNGILYLGTGEGNYLNNGFGINNNTIGMLGNGVYKSTTLNSTNKNWAANLTSDDAKYSWATQEIKFELLDFTRPTSQYNYGDGKAFVNKIAVNRSTNKVYVATNDGLMQFNDDATNWTMVPAIGNATIGDIVSNKNGVLAVYYNDSKANVMLSSNDFVSSNIVLSADSLDSFDTASLSINRIRLAFGNTNPNKLYAYVNYFAEAAEGVRYYRELLVRTNDYNSINWRRTTAQTYYNAGTPDAMSIVVNDIVSPEEVYLGGNTVMKGYDANNSDIYYWERISTYTNSQNSTNGIRTSPTFVNSGINEIIIKENPLNSFDSTLIVVATDGGIHTYSYDPILFRTEWNLSTKNMITTQFYSVGVSPDGSVVGGTEANGSVYIANSGNIGENKSGDVIWTVNSPGYNPNGFQYSTSGGKVGTSQFQRILPTPRKSLILSRPLGQIARTYGNNGDYSVIDDVTWNYSSSLFPNGIIENSTWRPYEPAKTPMFLWESTNSQLPDSMFLVINKNTSVNFVYDTTWREGSIINIGDSVLAKSPTMEYPFTYTFTKPLQYNQDTAIRIKNPIQSRLFFGTSQGVFVCPNINDYIASPLQGSLTPITMVKFYETTKFANVPTEEINCFAITDDGKTLFVSADKVSANSDTTFLYRFDLSNKDFQNSQSSISIIPEVMIFTRKITSISVDKNNGNNMILTFGTYLSSKSNIQVSNNALAQPFSSATFKEAINVDPINDENFLPNNKPVFCALIESVTGSTDKVAYIGAEDGIYKTDNYLGTPATGGKVTINWEKMQGIPNVPVFQLTQQTMRLPKYEFYNYVGQNSFQTSFARTELPGAIYAATYGKGLFAYLGDTIAPNETVIGINENIAKINQTTNLRLYPNPANSSTTLEYNLSETSNVNLQVYDMSGRMVSSLDNGRQQAGQHSLQMNVQNLKSGIYMVRIITNNTTSTAKLIVR